MRYLLNYYYYTTMQYKCTTVLLSILNNEVLLYMKNSSVARYSRNSWSNGFCARSTAFCTRSTPNETYLYWCSSLVLVRAACLRGRVGSWTRGEQPEGGVDQIWWSTPGTPRALCPVLLPLQRQQLKQDAVFHKPWRTVFIYFFNVHHALSTIHFITF